MKLRSILGLDWLIGTLRAYRGYRQWRRDENAGWDEELNRERRST